MSANQSILVFLLLAVLFTLFLYILATLVSPYQPTASKNAPYECGFPAIESTRKPFTVQFYIVAILFIVFDVEAALLFPWAMNFRELDWFGMICMLHFLGLLGVVFVYEWLAGALEWE